MLRLLAIFRLKSLTVGLSALVCLAGTNAAAQDSAFGEGWRVDPTASNIFFQSIKNNAVVETSTFNAFSGAIDPTGAARIEIELNSIDTKIDLRNVRMRFLFFETFRFPKAALIAQIDPATLAGVVANGRDRMPLPVTVDLHGVKAELNFDVLVTQFAPNRVAVASAEPIFVSAKTFDLMEGVLKLEDAAKVDILPAGSVSFDIVFERLSGTPVAAVATPLPAPAMASAPAVAAKVALEPEGAFTADACMGRFEILSRTGSIQFKSGSAELASESDVFLKTVLDVVERCPMLDIVVQGHTDSVGGAAGNRALSQSRANSVATFLIGEGVAKRRISSVGFGEEKPIASNDTERGRRLNRRIEFAAIQVP